MERRLTTNNDLHDLYTNFMSEYESLGHMERAPPLCDRDTRRCFYLPHHGILRETSTTTKLRVVFNGSARTNLGRSLNQSLHTGPALQPNLIDILLRWRMHRYVCSADIEKMYRQIVIHPDDRDFQRILWRTSPVDPIQEYRLCTVTYGLSIAPYLALRVLQQLKQDEAQRFPNAARILEDNFYVDDCLFGGDDLESTLAVQREAIDCLMAGGFPLKKWTANHPRLLQSLPEDWLASNPALEWHQGQEHRLLGLTWQSNEDCFVFSSRSPDQPEQCTKRNVLSKIAQLFDPLGLLSPITIRAKILMQRLWMLKLDWDAFLPSEVQEQWTDIYLEFSRLTSLTFPRWNGFTQDHRVLELHGFSDASEEAYAATVYLRIVSPTHQVTSILLCAKTKVAPLQKPTIPRLELCGTVLLCKLALHVQTALRVPNAVLHLWSDSTVALAWLASTPNRWQPFVAHRVAFVQSTLPSAQWHHVAGSDNPADLATRGISAEDLSTTSLWTHGPEFLRATSAPWEHSTLELDPEQCPERRASGHAAHKPQTEPWDLIYRFSSLQRLLRITAWCRRYVWNLHAKCRNAPVFLQSWLNADELISAEVYWTRSTQRCHFNDEMASLENRRSLPSRSPLVKLTPTLEPNGVLRLGGRLRHSNLSPDEKHPLILPETSAFTELLISDRHLKALHGGTQLTLSTIRRTHWVLNGRRIVKKVIATCLPCIRYRASACQQQMGNLPPERARPSRPFQHTGVDYAGPIKLRTTPGRGHKTYKGYIAVFVCFSTRAVHLEAVSGYSTEHFLAALRRFVSRRGLCSTLHSDCGTNFVGADAELRALLIQGSTSANAIAQSLAPDGIEWKFNPPSAPHFGGLWEAAVKSTKHHLKRVLGDSTLTFEEMTTLLTQIEACLNSRPLQPLSDDPDDLVALTPGNFLIGTPITAIPEPSLDSLPSSRLSRWHQICKMRDLFWQQWTSHYLKTLTQRQKWVKAQPSLKVGDLVLIKGENLPPTKWPLARVIATHPGSDGHVRVVTLRTATTTLQRPIAKLCLLPLKE